MIVRTGVCGRSGHKAADCPRSTRVAAAPRPPEPEPEPEPELGTNVLRKLQQEQEEAAVAPTVRYLDPSLLCFTKSTDDEDTGPAQTPTNTDSNKPSKPANPDKPDMTGGVLIVAEKPSVAKAIAQHLSRGRLRTTSSPHVRRSTVTLAFCNYHC